MKAIAFAVMAIFLLNGCTVRIAKPHDHIYANKSYVKHHYQERKSDHRSPVRVKAVYRDIAKAQALYPAYFVKDKVHYQNVHRDHHPKQPEKKRNRKVHKQERGRKTNEQPEGKEKKQAKHKKATKED